MTRFFSLLDPGSAPEPEDDPASVAEVSRPEEGSSSAGATEGAELDGANGRSVGLRPAALGRAADLLGLFEVPAGRGEREIGRMLSRDSRFRRLLIAADVVAAAIALFVGVLVTSGDGLRVGALLTIPVVVLTSKAIGLYDRDELLLHKATLDEAPSVLQLALVLPIFVWLAEPLMVSGALDKVGFLAIASTTFVGCLMLRASARWLATQTTPPERCFFLGPAESFELLAAKLALGGCSGARLVGRTELEDADGRSAISGELAAVLTPLNIDRVILAPTSAESDAVLDLIREAKALEIKVSLMPRLSEVLGSSVAFDDLHGVTVLAIRHFGLSRSSKVMKRCFDLLIAGGCFVAIAPLLAALALAVKATSPGPAFYRQTRIGRGGRPFEILKLRTMMDGAHELRSELADLSEADGLFKIPADPRVTRLGRFLRRTSLDEAPQLLNVLRGDMSLVGPRPLVADEDAQIVGWHRQRLEITPGMTGHWQVLGPARIPLQEMLAIDYLYVANWSLWTDLKYLLRTVPFVLGARGL